MQPSEDEQNLLQAIREADLDKVKALLDKGVDPASQGNLPIFLAAQEGHLDIIKCLVSYGADYAAAAEYGFYDLSRDISYTSNDHAPIRLAVANGHLNIIDYLVSQGANPSLDDNFCICLAAEKGHRDVIEYLVSQGAALDARDNLPIRFAVGAGYVDSLEYFLKQGIAPDIRDNELICLAAQNGQYNIIKHLVEQGADPAARDNLPLLLAARSGHFDIFEYLLKQGASFRDFSLDKMDDIIRLAAKSGRLDILEHLVKERPDARIQDDSALFYAAENGHLNVVEYLVAQGADPTVLNNASLLLAAENGHLNVVEYLLKQGADPTAQDNLPLLLAAKNGHLKVVEYLVTQGANPTARDNRALLLAAKNAHLNVIEYLLTQGADPTVQDCRPIHLAIESMNYNYYDMAQIVDVVKFLAGLEVMASIELEADEKSVAREKIDLENDLIAAVKNGHLSETRALIKLGADPAVIQDNQLIFLAAKNGHKDMVKLLASLDGVDLSAGNAEFFQWVSNNIHLNEELISAASSGNLSAVKALIKLGADPATQDNSPICLASQGGHFSVMAFLAELGGVDFSNAQFQWEGDDEEPRKLLMRALYKNQTGLARILINNPLISRNFSKGVQLAIRLGYLEAAIDLIQSELAFVTDDEVFVREVTGRPEEAEVLRAYIQDPEVQAPLLSWTQEVLFEAENERGISGRESSMDKRLELQAKIQFDDLKEKYKDASVEEGLALLRRLVFQALLEHVTDAGAPSERQAFLENNMDDLIAGKEEAFQEAVDKTYFDSNEDMYEIAFRSLNPQRATEGGEEDWENLLTGDTEGGKWVQEYAANIARVIAEAKEEPFYKDCILSLITRLAEIRRAHNENDIESLDNPSCLPGTKTRLLRVLETHPAYKDYIKPNWKEAFYEGASRHIQTIFRETLEEISSPEEAEFLFDSLLALTLENVSAIEAGEPVMMIDGTQKVYTREHSEKRLEFIAKIRETLAEEVNKHLLSEGHDFINMEDLPEDAEEEEELMVLGDFRRNYLYFAEKALGEPWIRQKLSDIYAAYAPRPEAADALEASPLETLFIPKKRQALEEMRQRQVLKQRFYEYAGEAPLDFGMVNAFFASQDKLPENEAEEQTLFEACLLEQSKGADESSEASVQKPGL